MPPQRRLYTTFVLAVTAILVVLYVFTGSTSTRSSAFYTRTAAVLNAKRVGDTTPKTPEPPSIKTTLNDILKHAPIVVFSKTYCPYSQKAKRILLQDWKIVPEPYVVEIDIHPMGPQLQTAVFELTGRKTVPNILVNGKSIGGGDDVEALSGSDALRERLMSMGGKRLVTVARN